MTGRQADVLVEREPRDAATAPAPRRRRGGPVRRRCPSGRSRSRGRARRRASGGRRRRCGRRRRERPPPGRRGSRPPRCLPGSLRRHRAVVTDGRTPSVAPPCASSAAPIGATGTPSGTICSRSPIRRLRRNGEPSACRCTCCATSVEQRPADLGDPAAEHHVLDVAGEHEQPDGGGDGVGVRVPHGDGVGAPRRGGGEDRGGRGAAVAARPRGVDRGPRGVELQAAALAARAERTGGVVRDVPDLAGPAAGSAAHLPAEQETRPRRRCPGPGRRGRRRDRGPGRHRRPRRSGRSRR